MTTYTDRFSARDYDLILTVTQGTQSVAGNWTDLNCSLKIVDAGQAPYPSWDKTRLATIPQPLTAVPSPARLAMTSAITQASRCALGRSGSITMAMATRLHPFLRQVLRA